jgi:hypothetical protein
MSPPLLCVVHIPKTAGSALREGLITALGHEKVYWIGHKRPFADWYNATGTEFNDYKVVGGHVSPEAFDKIKRPKLFLAVMRNPVRRAASLFNYITRGTDLSHPYRDKFQNLSLMESIAKYPRFRIEIANYQCKLIGGEPTLPAAILSLLQRDWIISCHEHVETLFRHVCKTFDWPVVPLPQDNVGEIGYERKYLDSITNEFLKDANESDSALYNVLRSEAIWHTNIGNMYSVSLLDRPITAEGCMYFGLTLKSSSSKDVDEAAETAETAETAAASPQQQTGSLLALVKQSQRNIMTGSSLLKHEHLAPQILSTGKRSMHIFERCQQDLSCRVTLPLGANIPVRFEAPVDGDDLQRRLIRGMHVVNYLYYEYICRRFDMTNVDNLDDDAAVYLQATDNPISIENCLAFQRDVVDTNLTLIPDPDFFESLGYYKVRYSRECATPWSDRKAIAFWRGSTTGLLDGKAVFFTSNMTTIPRIKLCEIGAAFKHKTDFGITQIVQGADHTCTLQLREYCEQKRLLEKFTPQMSMAQFKMLIDIDGNANSWGFLVKLLLGSCVLKVDSEWEQWYYHRTRPWTHFVPVRRDLSDLMEKIDWCLENDQEARSIAEAGAECARRMSFNSEMSDTAERILRSISVSKLPRSGPSDPMEKTKNASETRAKGVIDAFESAVK